MKNIKELTALKSDRFLLWVAIATLPLISANTYFVYNQLSRLSPGYRETVSVGVSLVLAGFILIYTVRKNYKMAKYFAYFEALISAFYYVSSIGWHVDLLPAIGFVLILPAALYYSTKEINGEKEEEPQKSHVINWQHLIDNRDESIVRLSKIRDELVDSNTKLDVLNKTQYDEIHYLKTHIEDLQRLRNQNLEELAELRKFQAFTNLTLGQKNMRFGPPKVVIDPVKSAMDSPAKWWDNHTKAVAESMGVTQEELLKTRPEQTSYMRGIEEALRQSEPRIVTMQKGAAVGMTEAPLESNGTFHQSGANEKELNALRAKPINFDLIDEPPMGPTITAEDMATAVSVLSEATTSTAKGFHLNNVEMTEVSITAEGIAPAFRTNPEEGSTLVTVPGEVPAMRNPPETPVPVTGKKRENPGLSELIP